MENDRSNGGIESVRPRTLFARCLVVLATAVVGADNRDWIVYDRKSGGGYDFRARTTSGWTLRVLSAFSAGDVCDLRGVFGIGRGPNLVAGSGGRSLCSGKGCDVS